MPCGAWVDSGMLGRGLVLQRLYPCILCARVQLCASRLADPRRMHVHREVHVMEDPLQMMLVAQGCIMQPCTHSVRLDALDAL